PPSPTPFPYTTLFRSSSTAPPAIHVAHPPQRPLFPKAVAPRQFCFQNRKRNTTLQATRSIQARARWPRRALASYDMVGSCSSLRSEEHTSELQSRSDL